MAGSLLIDWVPGCTWTVLACQVMATDTTQMQLEETLKAQLKDRGASPIILSIGARGSGKSFHMLSMLMWCLQNKCYDKYHCVLPTWHYEQNYSYTFLWWWATRRRRHPGRGAPRTIRSSCVLHFAAYPRLPERPWLSPRHHSHIHYT